MRAVIIILSVVFTSCNHFGVKKKNIDDTKFSSVEIINRKFSLPEYSKVDDLGDRYQISFDNMSIYINEGTMLPSRIDELLSLIEIKFDTTTQFKKIYYGISMDKKMYFLMERGLDKNTILAAGYYPFMTMSCKIERGATPHSIRLVEKIFESYLTTTKQTPYNQ